MQRIPYEITLSKARNQVGAFFFSDVRIFFLVFAQFFVFVLWWAFGSETLKFSVLVTRALCVMNTRF